MKIEEGIQIFSRPSLRFVRPPSQNKQRQKKKTHLRLFFRIRLNHKKFYLAIYWIGFKITSKSRFIQSCHIHPCPPKFNVRYNFFFLLWLHRCPISKQTSYFIRKKKNASLFYVFIWIKSFSFNFRLYYILGRAWIVNFPIIFFFPT